MSSENLVLNVLISTIDAGIDNIKKILLPKRADVVYIVSHQYRDNKYKYIPTELDRDDVIVSQIFGQGLSISRNNAINVAKGDIAVLSDDDVVYTNKFFDSIIEKFIDDKIDAALFKIMTFEDESDYKRYPNESYKLSKNNFHSPSSIEIAFRINKIKGKYFFDKRFGLGSKLDGGEEYLFVKDLLKGGMNVFFYPTYIVIHSKDSFIKQYSRYHKRRNRVTGAIEAREYGIFAYLKAFISTIRIFNELIKNKKNPLIYLLERYSGINYIMFSK